MLKQHPVVPGIFRKRLVAFGIPAILGLTLLGFCGGRFADGDAEASVPYRFWINLNSKKIGQVISAYCESMDEADKDDLRHLINDHSGPHVGTVLCYGKISDTTKSLSQPRTGEPEPN